MSGIPRIYTSFAEFEREELRRLDTMNSSVDDMVEERFAEDLDFGQSGRFLRNQVAQAAQEGAAAGRGQARPLPGREGRVRGANGAIGVRSRAARN